MFTACLMVFCERCTYCFTLLVNYFKFDMFAFVVDIHRNILSAQCFIQCKISNDVDKILIIIQSNFLEIFFYSGIIVCQQSKLFYPSNFFIPTTFSSVKNAASVYIPNDDKECQVKIEYKLKQSDLESSSFQASFRLQISNDHLVNETLLKCNNVLNCRDFLKTIIKPDILYQISCTKCKSILNEAPIKFENIEDYQTDNSELSESWFCHSYIEAKSKLMKSNTCYVSEMCVYLHQSIVKTLHVGKCEKYYKCINCDIFLSASKTLQTFIPFFCDAITLKTLDEESSNLKSSADIILMSFQNLIENSTLASVSNKLYICCKTASKEKCILLWITCQKVAQGLLQFELKDMPKEMHLTTKEVYKVLYCVPDVNSKIGKSWKHDCNVDYNYVSENMLVFVIELLESSSKLFPNLESTQEHFKFGYLPAYNCKS